MSLPRLTDLFQILKPQPRTTWEPIAARPIVPLRFNLYRQAGPAIDVSQYGGLDGSRAWQVGDEFEHTGALWGKEMGGGYKWLRGVVDHVSEFRGKTVYGYTIYVVNRYGFDMMQGESGLSTATAVPRGANGTGSAAAAPPAEAADRMWRWLKDNNRGLADRVRAEWKALAAGSGTAGLGFMTAHRGVSLTCSAGVCRYTDPVTGQRVSVGQADGGRREAERRIEAATQQQVAGLGDADGGGSGWRRGGATGGWFTSRSVPCSGQSCEVTAHVLPVSGQFAVYFQTKRFDSYAGRYLVLAEDVLLSTGDVGPRVSLKTVPRAFFDTVEEAQRAALLFWRRSGIA